MKTFSEFLNEAKLSNKNDYIDINDMYAAILLLTNANTPAITQRITNGVLHYVENNWKAYGTKVNKMEVKGIRMSDNREMMIWFDLIDVSYNNQDGTKESLVIRNEEIRIQPSNRAP